MAPDDANAPKPVPPPAEPPAVRIQPQAPSPPGKKLTPEEQMALYEDSLKETDWGHQPC